MQLDDECFGKDFDAHSYRCMSCMVLSSCMRASESEPVYKVKSGKKVCLICNCDISYMHKNRRTCSAACRVKLSRRNKNK